MLQYFLHEKKEISPILKKSPIKFSSKLTFFHIFYNDLRLIGWLWLTNLVAYSFVFLTRSSTNLSVKSNWKKKKIGLAFTVTSIFNPICSLNEKSFIVGWSSFRERLIKFRVSTWIFWWINFIIRNCRSKSFV